ncbi:hypothetical protein [Hafnia psychrotolerans]|uniref:hypothetical protein n=1 Tax=Hafnia psychrotolerans TaxID=1477018 RepID=UPI00166AB3F8|nr:hypothetical protein [Hafnia psychrotolerans]
MLSTNSGDESVLLTLTPPDDQVVEDVNVIEELAWKTFLVQVSSWPHWRDKRTARR